MLVPHLKKILLKQPVKLEVKFIVDIHKLYNESTFLHLF